MVVVLVGFMGAGKTTVGHIIAERLGLPFVDSDVLIEQRLGCAIRDIFATEGEAYFRQLEHVTVADLIRGPEAVIALGGGAAEDPRSRTVLRHARVVYLRVSYDEAMSRVKSDEFRPMLHRPGLDEVYKRRLPGYEDLSVLTVDTDGRQADAVALDVLSGLARLPATGPTADQGEPPMDTLITGNRVAASVAAPDTDSCLQDLERLAPRIGLAEIRLDLMHTFDIEKLVTSSPVPLILTCRPERERGGYAGPERERLAILRTACESGCAYVDVEADSLDSVSGWRGSATRVIASQHWFGHMPADLAGRYLDLRDRCAVVKLVGTARSATDVLPVLELLRDATTPVIGMAMGSAGTCTRIISPAFRHSLLTYGSTTAASQTAPGQITVDEMVDRYALHLVNADTRVHLHVTSTDRQDQDVLRAQEKAVPGAELHVSLRTTEADSPALAGLLAGILPDASVTAAARV
jgi:3-dehydroquinate dehydratase type I